MNNAWTHKAANAVTLVQIINTNTHVHAVIINPGGVHKAGRYYLNCNCWISSCDVATVKTSCYSGIAVYSLSQITLVQCVIFREQADVLEEIC